MNRGRWEMMLLLFGIMFLIAVGAAIAWGASV